VSGEKTEKPTPKKLRDLRRKGSAARSTELPAGVSLVALVAVLPWMLGRFFQVLRTDLTVTLSAAGSLDLGQARGLVARLVLDTAQSLAPPVALVSGAAIVSGCLVTRSAPNPAMLKPQFSRLSPAKTLKRMLSTHSLVDLTKNTLKLAVLTAVTYSSWKKGYATLVREGSTPADLQELVGSACRTLLWQSAALAVLVGVADAAYQRRSFNKQARMSKQDIKEEAKQSEGNPEAKGAIRARQLAVARGRMIEAVPKADVVLANPTHLVVALQYTPGTAAPVVVAKGAGPVADRIKQVAAEHGVPVLHDKPLARALYKATEVGDTVPAELFRVVAEVLATVYSARRRGVRPSWSPRPELAGATA
jgi:flagellar biosynthetic protein FlhB